MPFEMPTLAHIGAGTLTLVLYWATFAQTKGSPAHKRLGRWFVASWALVLTSVGAVTLLRPVGFTPPEAIQFAYLSICVIVVTATAFLAIRWKGRLDRFRGFWFKASGVLIFALGAFLFVVGLAQGLPMPLAFSSVGLIYGAAMIRFAWMTREPHRNWSLIWHLNGMIFLLNAIHGTLLAVAWRYLVDPAAGDWLNVVTHFGTMAICLWLRLWFGARRNAPLRLTAERPRLAMA